MYIDIVTALMMGSIIVTLLGGIYLRKRLLDRSFKLDRLANTPSDFTLLGYCPNFSAKCNYTKVSIEEEVKEYLKSFYGIEDIEYVNVVYDIHDVYEITEKLETNLKHKQLIGAFIENMQWSSDAFRTADPSLYPDWPKVQTKCNY